MIQDIPTELSLEVQFFQGFSEVAQANRYAWQIRDLERQGMVEDRARVLLAWKRFWVNLPDEETKRLARKAYNSAYLSRI